MRSDSIIETCLNVGDLLLEFASQTSQSTTSTSGNNDVIDLAVALFNQFFGGTVVVSQRVGRIFVLKRKVRFKENFAQRQLNPTMCCCSDLITIITDTYLIQNVRVGQLLVQAASNTNVRFR